MSKNKIASAELHGHLSKQQSAFLNVRNSSPGIEKEQKYKELLKEFNRNVTQAVEAHNSKVPAHHQLINKYTIPESDTPVITDYCKCEKTPVLDFCKCDDTPSVDSCKCDETKSLSVTADLVTEKIKEINITHADIPEHLKEFVTNC